MIGYEWEYWIGLIVTIIYLMNMAIERRKEIKEAFIKVKNKVVKIFGKLKEKKGKEGWLLIVLISDLH